MQPADLKTFTAEAFNNFHTTSAVVPSSRYLTRAMLAPLPLGRARTVVEFGGGTGAITRALLDALPAQATLLSFEINPRFRAYLQAAIPDPRLEVIPAGAERVREELGARGIREVDAAVSSLGLTFMPAKQRHAILRGLLGFMSPAGVLTQFQYLHGLLPHIHPADRQLQCFIAARWLRSYFPQVTSEVIWRNFPPAIVFACRR